MSTPLTGRMEMVPAEVLALVTVEFPRSGPEAAGQNLPLVRLAP